nr:hypothetical protein [Deltaproteobacteria bacterium]
MAEDTPCDDLKTRMQEITCAEKARMQDEGILSDEIAPELMQAALEANEIGDAILLQKLFGNHLIWDNSIEKWHLFNGQHWELDNQNQYLWLTEKCT